MLQSLLQRSEFVRRIRGYWGVENKVADLCKKTIDSYVPKLMSTQVKLPLQTERLLIRDLKESDWEAVHSYASDPEVTYYMPWEPHNSEQTTNFIQKALAMQQDQPRQNFELAVILKAQGQLIGVCGFRVSDLHNQEGWIGYCFNRHEWGQGYATEAVIALLALGFGQLSLHRIIATCDPANVASMRVLEKIGMYCEGHLRENKWVKGKWRDTLLYAILESEWRLKAKQDNSFKP